MTEHLADVLPSFFPLDGMSGTISNRATEYNGLSPVFLPA